ncbi:hypothetical protein J7337_010111 [Fusarium musae]|uniref:Xylanolytic transcriptional activator regulatory domain-containing protein n=1 Tax=Fusarium musae TaxID=1042133 RepID=A0A9P8DCK9_9HYPO|nr:hypothetical protein J7337_010111 [Fusarium musae]KAG9499291.1 hypothetical protein J7337_010111 [Fusarium musae]
MTHFPAITGYKKVPLVHLPRQPNARQQQSNMAAHTPKRKLVCTAYPDEFQQQYINGIPLNLNDIRDHQQTLRKEDSFRAIEDEKDEIFKAIKFEEWKRLSDDLIRQLAILGTHALTCTIHSLTFKKEWSQGKLEKTLLKAICASALRLAPTYRSESSQAHNWMKQVQHELVNHMGDMSVPKMQALMLVIKFLFSMRFTGDVWVLLSIASRVAFTKRLNYERPAIDPVRQECLRRLMWSIYVVDKIFSGGIEDLTVILSGTSPYLSRDQLRSLDLELTSFEESLPDELQLNENRLMIMCHSEEARTYTTLHTILFSSRCDLHRFLIPGIREAVSPEAENQTPREYIDYCQQQCLQTALRFIDMWSKVRQMETSSRVGTPTFAVVTYQFVKMVDHLAALLPLHGESSLPVIKQKFMDILLIVSGSRAEVGWIGTCEKLHRRSKHAFAPDDEEEEDPAIRPPESNTGEEIPETSLESTVLENTAGQDIWSFPVQGSDEQGLTGSTGDGSLGSFSSLGYPLVNYDSINSADLVFGDQELGFPLDPFDLQMNAYTDANAPQY